MRFWDASAVGPLVVDGTGSTACRRLLRSDPRMTVWALTATEVLSALCRLRRVAALDDAGLARAEERLSRLGLRWDEVEDLAAVREEAARILRTHALRTADALQLAAAVVAVDHRPRGRAFVCLDQALAAAAAREGFGAIGA